MFSYPRTIYLKNCVNIRAMKIAGLQKLTLLDYPGKTAATVFTPGCIFRCPFCQNIDLVLPATQKDLPLLSEEDFFSFLNKRKGLLDAICITGGEPTLQPDLAQFCKQIKEQGFLVKLDTNGSRPEILERLLSLGCLDYVAMDIKNTPTKYASTVGLAESKTSQILEAITQSIHLLLQGTIPLEFRTTVVAELHDQETLIALATWLAQQTKAAQKKPEAIQWFLQQFVDSDTVLAGEGCFTSWSEKDLQVLLPTLQAVLPKTELRGV